MAESRLWGRFKVETLTTLGQALVPYLWSLLLPILGGTVMAYLASISEVLSAWGPVAWGGVGFLSALVIVCIWWVTVHIQQKRSVIELNHAFAEKPRAINPLSDSFEQETIRLADLFFPPDVSMRNKTFRRCRFIGPGVLFFMDHCTILKPSMGASNLVTVHDDGMFYGLTAFQNCQFVECEFFWVTMILSQNLAHAIVLDTRKRGQPPPLIFNYREPKAL